jgi:hypothetical protein
MDNAKDTALKEYEDTLTYSLTYYPTGDAALDRRVMDALWDADMEVERQGLRGTAEYNAMVLRADTCARALRAAQRPKT